MVPPELLAKINRLATPIHFSDWWTYVQSELAKAENEKDTERVEKLTGLLLFSGGIPKDNVTCSMVHTDLYLKGNKNFHRIFLIFYKASDKLTNSNTTLPVLDLEEIQTYLLRIHQNNFM